MSKRLRYFLVYAVSQVVAIAASCDTTSYFTPVGNTIHYDSLTTQSRFVGFQVDTGDGEPEFYRGSTASGVAFGRWNKYPYGSPDDVFYHRTRFTPPYYTNSEALVPGTWYIIGNDSASESYTSWHVGILDSSIGTNGMRLDLVSSGPYHASYNNPQKRNDTSYDAGKYNLGAGGGVTFRLTNRDTLENALKHAVARGYDEPEEGHLNSAILLSQNGREISARSASYTADFDLCAGDYVSVATFTRGGDEFTRESSFTVPLDQVGYYTLTEEIPAVKDVSTSLKSLRVERRADCSDSETKGDSTTSMSSVHFSINLGSLDGFSSAGRLFLEQESINADSFEPVALSYLAPDKRVTVIEAADGSIRQIVAPEVFVDIQNTAGAGYSIDVYDSTAADTLGDHDLDPLTPDTYSLVTGSQPLFEYTLSERAFDGALVIQKTSDGSTDEVSYLEEAITNGTAWTFTEGGGLRKTRREYTAVSSSVEKERTTVSGTFDGDELTTSVVEETYELYQSGGIPLKRLLSRVEDPDETAETDTYTYYDGTNPVYEGLLKRRVDADGSWEWRVYDEVTGELTIKIRGLANNPAPALTAAVTTFEDQNEKSVYSVSTLTDQDGDTVEETLLTTIDYVQGVAVAKRFTLHYSQTQLLNGYELRFSDQIRCGTPSAAWNATGNLITKNAFYKDGPFAGQLRWRLNPDGTGEVIHNEYSLDGGSIVTRFSGKLEADFDADEPLVSGIKSVAERNTEGYEIDSNRYDIANGAETLVAREFVNTLDPLAIDEFGRPLVINYLDGTSRQLAYACCGLSSETSRDGLTTTYLYDDLGRLEYRTSASGTTAQQVEHMMLDASGNVRKRYIGPDLESLRLVAEYDYALTGRLTHERVGYLDNLPSTDRQTIYSESEQGSYQLSTVTFPNQSTRINKSYTDGRLYETTGTATRQMRYAYAVELDSDLGYSVNTRTQTYLDADGELTGEYTKAFTDALGRTYKTVKPAADGTLATSSNFYNSLGQLASTADPDGLTTLYAYNDRGELEITAIDANGDDLITYTGDPADRITRTTTFYTTRTEDSLTFPVLRRVSEVWEDSTQGLASVVATVDSTYEALPTGLPGNITWSTQYNRTTRTDFRIDSANASQTTTTAAPAGNYQVQVVNNGLLASATSYHSDGSILSQQSYTYDEDNANRVDTIFDLHRGTTDYEFYLDGQPKRITTPDPDATQSGPGYDPQQTSFTYADSAAGITRTTTLPDTTQRTESFAPTGDLLSVEGSQTYPVSYSYDYAGRMQTQTTWQDKGAEADGSALTLWEYFPNGQLKKKWYNAAIDEEDGSISGTAGPSYTYTAAGRLKTKVNARAATATYAYDPNSLDLTGVAYTGDSDLTADVSYDSYDRLGRPDQISDASGTRTLSYNAGRLQDETYTAGPLAGYSIDRELDAFDRPWELDLLDATTALYEAVYAYDGAARLESVTQGDQTITYSYDPAAELRQTRSYHNGIAEVYFIEERRDQLDRLTSIRSIDAAGAILHEQAYRYNSLNQRTRQTDLQGHAWHYGYDALGQLDSAVRKTATDAVIPGYGFGYTFDDIGNRTQTTTNGRAAAYTPNALNQYDDRAVPRALDVRGTAAADASVTVNGHAATRTGEAFYHGLDLSTLGNSAQMVDLVVTASLPDGGDDNAPRIADVEKSEVLPANPENLDYDLDGNLKFDSRWSYTWNAENRLIAMETLPVAYNAGAPRQKLEFAYDSQGRRFSKKVYDWDEDSDLWSLTSDLRYLYDGWNLIAELDLINSPLSTLHSTYLWGTDISGTMQGAGGVGGLLARSDASGSTSYPAYDGNGNIMGYYEIDSQQIGSEAQLRIRPGGLKAEYFNNTTFTEPVAHHELIPTVDFYYERFDPPADGVNADNYSMRASGYLRPEFTETYTLTVNADDRCRLWVDGVAVVPDWNTYKEVTVDLTAGQDHELIFEFYEMGGAAKGYLWWKSASQPKQIIPSDRLISEQLVDVPIFQHTAKAVAEFEYGPFGEPLRASGPKADEFNFRFSTKYQDAETGLLYYGYRYYDAETGRWLSRDPIGERGGLNLYGMVGNDPINFWDYLGLTALDCGCDADGNKVNPATDDAGRQCCPDKIQTVQLRVKQPNSPVRNQVAENLANGTPKADAGNGIRSGHTFLYVPSSGRGVGFYPNGQWRGKRGKLNNDSSAKYTHFKSYRVCPETQQLIQDQISEDAKNPPIYDILDSQYGDETAHCTTWACETLSDAGIDGVPNVQEPYDLANQPGFSPKP